ncbi:MAG TPA: FAD-binding oxidoreductase [Actinomycetes bacterium]|nr:FAD-binding oxidoreductase [Actinomycetes bacterium]
MAGTAVRGRLTWTLGTVVELADQTERVRSILLEVPGWPGHRPGQHVDVRLTAEDGYQAQRSYSIASAPGERLLELAVELLPDGEVSPYLTRELRVADRLELRGPVGGWFVWEPALGGPLLLVGGGSGIVPLVAIARHRAAVAGGAEVPARLLYSARTRADVLFAGDLERLAGSPGGLEVVGTLTRERPPGWPGRTGRVDAGLLAEVAWPAARRPLAFVCGPTGFVELVAGALAGLGLEPGRIRTERFGPTGT